MCIRNVSPSVADPDRHSTVQTDSDTDESEKLDPDPHLPLPILVYFMWQASWVRGLLLNIDKLLLLL
jgi:hypothetical protein